MTTLLRYACGKCEAEVRVPLAEDPARAACPGCGAEKELRRGATAGGRVAHCPLCGCGELYVTREFPRGIGLAVVGIAATASFVVYGATSSPYYSLLPLAAATILDAILYRFTPPLVVCYLCQAFLSGARTEGLLPFDAPKGLQYEFRRDKMGK